MSPNKLPWLLLVLMLIVGAWVASQKESEPSDKPVSGESEPPVPGMEGGSPDPAHDTSLETLQTIVAEIETTNLRLEELQQEKKDSDDLIGDLKRELKQVSQKLRTAGSSQQANTNTPVDLSLGSVGSNLSEAVSVLTELDEPIVVDDAASSYPLNEGVLVNNEIAGVAGYRTLSPVVQLLATQTEVIAEGEGTHITSNPLQDNLTALQVGDNAAKPMFTLHKGSTIFDAVAMTALIGRAPVGGQVSDPFPVKFIIGAENLSANGHKLPDIVGAIFTGKAIGDWTLSCIQVTLTSASFVFPDGTIRTVPNAQNTSQTDSGTQDASGGIGYATDAFGNCVAGQRITDRPVRSFWSFLGGAAEGLATGLASEQTTSVGDTNGVVSSVTGDSSQYLLGQSLTQGIQETRSSIDQLWADTFDVVYSKPGTKVVLHIEQQLEIDYEKGGRKVVYGQNFADGELD